MATRSGCAPNVATPIEAKAANTANADGVGLLRTELPFLDARAWPTEDQHAAVLRPILGKLAGQPVTVRTLDFADDKFPPFLAGQARHGHLGRGLPHMLADPHALTHQFRAILTAGAACDLRIMIPMVASVAELAACAEILDGAAASLGTAAPPIGAMIELAEAVATADDLARHAAFFSIGSNDLTSQILNLDRRDPAVTPALAAHPDVLRAIARTVDRGAQARASSVSVRRCRRSPAGHSPADRPRLRRAVSGPGRVGRSPRPRPPPGFAGLRQRRQAGAALRQP